MWQAVVTLISFVRGIAVSLESEARDTTDSGLTDDEWMASHGASYPAIFASGPYPTLAASLPPGADFDLGLDTIFEFGQRHLLDGYAKLLGD